MALTRHYDRQSGKDGPVSGALFVAPINFTEGVTGTYAHSVQLPAGMNLELVSVNVQASGIANTPSLTVGTAKAGAEIVAAVNVTTNLGDATLVSSSVTSGDVLDVRVVNAAGDTFDSVSVNLIGYVSAPPTSVKYR